MAIEGNGTQGDAGVSKGHLQFQCNICQMIFKNGKALGGHRKAHTNKGGDGSQPFEKNPRIPCQECDRTYGSSRSLYNHRRNKHYLGDQLGACPPSLLLDIGESSRAAAARRHPLGLMLNQSYEDDEHLALAELSVMHRRRPGKVLMIGENDNLLIRRRPGPDKALMIGENGNLLIRRRPGPDKTLMMGGNYNLLIPRRLGKGLMIGENYHNKLLMLGEQKMKNKRLVENPWPSKKARTAHHKGKGKAPMLDSGVYNYKPDRTYPCDECGTVFNNRFALAGHKSHPHRKPPGETSRSAVGAPEPKTTLELFHGESSQVERAFLDFDLNKLPPEWDEKNV